ncbi:MAG: hypothetical protein JWP76_6066, partial [Dactylosporangium sp.]|nr:hypothetical protein [Dactylosporangium sp.]
LEVDLVDAAVGRESRIEIERGGGSTDNTRSALIPPE